ncbi:MAG TPA: hypothetical protein VI731_11565 [Bacteroidia bacterium]|nr:hypothetical protein [Bacteroidia bacterium]
MNIFRNFAQKGWSLLAWWGILIFCVFTLIFQRLEGTAWKNIYVSDAAGYYSYLPVAFIYHDYQFNFLDTLGEKYPKVKAQENCRFCNEWGDFRMNKYFAGVAVMELPFFLIAHALSGSTENPRDGFSFYYMTAIAIAAVFYVMVGLFVLRLVLSRLHFPDWIIALVLAVIFFGTNLSYYTTWESGMSHAYSFPLICFFLLLVQLQLERYSARRIVLCGLVLALIALVRPVNVVIILAIPFLAGSWKDTRRFLQENLRRPLPIVTAFCLAAMVIFIQSYLYFLQSGYWWLYAYAGEKFDFTSPELYGFLFSYSNGFFVYAPAMFIAFMGIFTFIPNCYYRFYSFLFFLLIVTWIFSSWWAWTYGGAFGMRAMVEFLPLFGILLAFLIQQLARFKFAAPALILLILLPLTAFTQFQIWQYKNYMLPNDRMTKEMYWKVYLQTDPWFRFLFEGAPKPLDEDARLLYSYFNDLENRDTLIANWETVKMEVAYSGLHASKYEVPESNPPFWKATVSAILPDSNVYTGKKVLLYANMKFRVDNWRNNTNVLFQQRRNGEDILFVNIRLPSQVLSDKEWRTFEYKMEIPELQENDYLRVLPNKWDSTLIYIDDIDVRIYEK